jgi:hypothetical protein
VFWTLARRDCKGEAESGGQVIKSEEKKERGKR